MDAGLKTVYKKYQTVILPAAATLIALAIFGFLIVPQALEIPKNNDNLTTQKDRVTKLTKKSAALDDIDTVKYQDDSKTAMIALPSIKDYPGAFGQALFFLQSSGLQITDLSFANLSDEGFAKNYLVKVQVTGNSEQINDFMQKIKSAPRLMRVSEFDLAPASLQDANLLVGEISLMTYFKDLNIKAGAPDADLVVPSGDDLKILAVILDRKGQNPIPDVEAKVPSGKPNPFAK